MDKYVSPLSLSQRSLSELGLDLLPIRQAALRRFQFREAASFLLDQVEFHASHRFRGVDHPPPRHVAFADQDAESRFAVLSATDGCAGACFGFGLLQELALARFPVFAVQAANASWIRFDPRYRIGSAFYAMSNVELQHHLFRRVGGKDFDR